MERLALLKHEGRMQIVAHVSGNQIDILHCPFCGSGAVIARSDGTVECGYCTSVFTVQVQPQYNGFPQSVDGQPYQWPGMPEAPGVVAPDAPAGTNVAPGQDPMDPAANPDAMSPVGGGPGAGLNGPLQSSDPADGGDEDSDGDDDKPAFLKGKGDSSSSKSDKKKDKKKGDNPFAKKKSYRTLSGAELDEDNFLAHLAIAFAKNPTAVAATVKRARES